LQIVFNAIVHYEIEFYLIELYYMEYFGLSTGKLGEWEKIYGEEGRK
jgi:hypothetical protein